MSAKYKTIKPATDGKIRLMIHSVKVAAKATVLLTPKPDQTNIASSPRAMMLRNAGSGIPVCII